MRRALIPLLLLAALFAAPTPDRPALGQAPSAEPLRTAGDRPIDVRHLRLELQVDLPNQTVKARAHLECRALRKLDGVQLDAVGFEVRKVSWAGGRESGEARFRHDGGKLSIDLPRAVAADDDLELFIDYTVRRPRAGLHFFGPSKDDPDAPLTVWSQGEPTDNRHWIPCLDQPNVRQSTELIVTVAEGFEAVSNGALVSRTANDDKTVTFHWKQEKPHPSYLVTLVVGKFDVVKEEWNKVPVLYYVPPGRKDDAARTFARTREMLDFFSRRFGVDYPWEKYAQVAAHQFGGGMENTSATTLGDQSLLDERALLDRNADGLIAHELAHQWWGDLVTCRDWSHLWLNEGFASYAEALWAEHHEGADDYAYNILLKARAALSGGKERPVVDRRYPSPGSMFDARSYPKGALILHMLRQRLGEAAFWKGVQRYGVEHKYQSVETADLRRSLERVSGRDLERFFHDWTERPGAPTLEVASSYDAERKQARVVVKQTQAGEAFHFPLQVRFGFGDGRKPVVVEDLVTEKEQRLTVPLEERPTLIEIDPEQAVLAEFKETKGRDLWLAQLSGGTTVASRVRAAQQLGQSKDDADRAALAKALAAEKFWGVQVEVVAALGASGGEASRDALIEGLKHPQPKVRRACADQLGKLTKDARAAAALKALLEKGDPSYFVEAAAPSSYARLRQPQTPALLLPWLAKPSYGDTLRTAALAGLGEAHDLEALDVLLSWSRRGKPIRPRAAALRALTELARHAGPSDDQRKKIVTALVDGLESDSARLRMSAIQALRDLGPAARAAQSALEAAAERDVDERVRAAARQALAALQPPAPAELNKLRDEVERLKKEQEELRGRLEKYEKLERKAG
jgi:aminopeptidase N